MASNHSQYTSDEQDRNHGLTSETRLLSNHDAASIDAQDPQTRCQQNNICGFKNGDDHCYTASTSRPNQQTGYQAYQGQRSSIANDALILRHRRTGLYNHGSKSLELMGEHKVAKNKMDLLHWSKPSSQKSTFMMAFSPNGQKVASTHGDHRIYICDLNTGRLLDTLEGHPKTPWCFSWHPTNKDILASGCLSGEVRVWDLRSKACELWTSENNTIITSISFHPKERILAIATANAVHFWDWYETTPFAVTSSPLEKERVKYVEFDSTGSKLITGITTCTAITAYSRDSLQHRILDNYLNNGNIQQNQSDNRQNSEISTHHHRQFIRPPINSNENLNDNNLQPPPTPSTAPARNEELSPSSNVESNWTSKITTCLSRVARVYRNLESFEDSLRNTSLSTFNTGAQASANLASADPQITTHDDRSNVTLRETSQIEAPTSSNSDHRTSSQGLKAKDCNSIPDAQSKMGAVEPNHPANCNISVRNPISYEPLVVLFDELLETIQLSPMIIGGRTIDISRILAQNPVDLSNNLDYAVQFDSINQVNQNFIRISKLMSSIRLYRQIIQQILANNTGQGHYQPNQFLTAQNTGPPSHGNPAHIPIVLRYGALPGAVGLIDEHLDAGHRPVDPIMAIQFRNCARNVPLASVCKIDLLHARSGCISQAQQSIETLVSGPKNGEPNSHIKSLNDRLAQIFLGQSQSTADNIQESLGLGLHASGYWNQIRIIQPLYYPLLHLRKLISSIIEYPLTTSNAANSITMLRVMIEKFLTSLQSMIQINNGSTRLINLIHEISQNLTSRSWLNPLGRTFDELRLDVIHTFCIVDLTLHLARQIQFLQMQRLSAIARIGDNSLFNRSGQVSLSSDSPTNNNSAEPTQGTSSQETTVQLNQDSMASSSSFMIGDKQMQNQKCDSESPSDTISTSIDRTATDNPPGKRKNIYEISPSHSANKKAKVGSDHGTEMIDTSSKEANNNPVDGVPTMSASNTNSANSQYQQYPTGDKSSPTIGEEEEQLDNNSLRLLKEAASKIEQANVVARDVAGSRIGTTPNHQSETSQLLMPTEPPNVQRLYLAATPSTNLQIFMRIIQRVQATTITSMVEGTNPEELSLDGATTATNNIAQPPIEVRRRALSHDNSSMASAESRPEAELSSQARDMINRPRLVTESPSHYGSNSSHLDVWPRHQFHIIIPNHTRGPNVLWMTLPTASSNYRLQCWDFSPTTLPNINDASSKVVVNRCRIDNNASIDISKDGNVVACIVPQEDAAHPMINRYDLRLMSLNARDFGTCLYSIPQGPQAITISLSPSARFVIVGLSGAGRHSLFSSGNQDDPDGMSIAKVYELNENHAYKHVRDIKIKRQGALNLNAIRWMPRGIVYNVGQHPMYHHRYPQRRFNHA